MLLSLRAAFLAGALLVAIDSAFAETLTLDQAVARATASTPIERAGQAAVAAAQAGRRQADVRPNPSVIVQGDNLFGTGRYGVLGQAEVSGVYSQPIERGGKRQARVALADKEISVAEASARVARLELAATVELAFLDVIIANDAVKIADTRLTIEQGMQREALRRVSGYKDPLFVETRAAARVAQARIEIEAATERQKSARAALAAFWGGSGDELDVAGALFAQIPADNGLANADEALSEAQAARAGAAIRLEETRRIQDYTVSGGARFLRETNDIAAVAGITIPLARFDRNLGAIERARAERVRIEAMAEAARFERRRRLATLQAQAKATSDQAKAIVREIYPRTTKALAQVNEGYARGGFSFRDMQDAADAIIRAQDDWLEAITRYRDLLTEIDRLTGRFDTAQPTETNR